MLKSIDNCQICGSSVAKILLTKNIFLGGKKRESTWVECLECGTAHIDPYPTSNELFEYYSNGYLDMDFDGTSDQYSSHKLHYSSEYESIVFQNYLLSLNDAGYSTDELNCLSILDYGCANGIFCKFLINELGLNGDSIFGVDFPSDMLDKCRNISGNFFPISHLNTINRSFDLITLWNVIEHIHDPRSVLKSIIGLLNPFGEILIETPMYGLLAKKMNSHWSHFIVTEHINLFSRNSIKPRFSIRPDAVDKTTQPVRLR